MGLQETVSGLRDQESEVSGTVTSCPPSLTFSCVTQGQDISFSGFL